jgi:hypothetical protein|tara:strand:+ start:820 stop:1581 length:762 start_codon:yes stop_codon:yes gene_type:complete
MIIFSCVTREDSPIPEQDYIDSTHDYVMFHSVDVKVPSCWKKIKIKEEVNPRYTFAKVQMLSHEYFKKDHVWIDPKQYILKGLYTKFINEPKEYDCIMPKDIQRKYLLDELFDWYLYPCINEIDLISIVKDLEIMNYDYSLKASCNHCVYLRRYNKKTIKHNEMWFDIWKRYKLRTQLPWLMSHFLMPEYKVKYVNYYVNTPRDHQPHEWGLKKQDILRRKLALPNLVKTVKSMINFPYYLNNNSVSLRIDQL